jgi:serine/threonine protein kinase
MTGGSLEDRLKRGALTIEESLLILERIAAALDKAHDQGVIHRDLKPANILFDDDGNPYLSDFGIVKLSEATVRLTGDKIIGTPAYMSPEQAKGMQTIDHRSDIYALGVLMFQTLSGQLPFDADTPMGIAIKHIVEPSPPIRSVKPELPEVIESVLSKSLAKEANDRFSSAGEMATAMKEVRKPPQVEVGREDLPPEPDTILAPESPVFPSQPDPVSDWTIPYEDAPPPEPVRRSVRPGESPAYEDMSISQMPGEEYPAQWHDPLPPASQPVYPLKKERKDGLLSYWRWILGAFLVFGAVVVIAVIAGLTGLRGIQRQQETTTASVQDTILAINVQLTASANEQATSVAEQENHTATAEAQATQDAASTVQVQATRDSATAQAQVELTEQWIDQKATDAASVFSQWPLLLMETFDSNENDWYVGEYLSDRLTGFGSLVNGKYTWDVDAIDGFVWRSSSPLDKLSDFYLSVQARLVSGPPETSCYGLRFRGDGDDYYIFRICDDQTFDVNVYFGGEWTTLIDWSDSTLIVPDAANRLTIVAQGAHFQFYINDQIVGEVDDTHIASGFAGVMMSGAEDTVFSVEFDDFEVRAP